MRVSPAASTVPGEQSRSSSGSMKPSTNNEAIANKQNLIENACSSIWRTRISVLQGSSNGLVSGPLQKYERCGHSFRRGPRMSGTLFPRASRIVTGGMANRTHGGGLRARGRIGRNGTPPAIW